MSITNLEKQVTIVILAGGRGRRMNEQDKGWAVLAGKPLIQHVIDLVSQQSSNILINANQNINRYQALGYPVVSDQLSDFQGPLAGVAAAMEHVTTPYILTLPCDAPYVDGEYVQKMLAGLISGQTDLAVAFDGARIQPIHAIIPVRLLDDLKQFLGKNSRKVDTWYSQYAMGIIDFSKQKKMFENLNTLQELEAYE